MRPYTKPRVPEWHKNATIYEVNLRHYTPEGTLTAFDDHLERLKDMGVDILWFMPLHPVSEKRRKGKLGSPYAVADYYRINPQFGTIEDFKDVLQRIHSLGMHAIIDWIPNHTGWDHPWLTEHPEWFEKDAHGKIRDPINKYTGEPWGWTDVAALDYNNGEMRQAMIKAMSFWVEEMGVDGFRVDVAHGVPVDFWEECTDALYSLRPLFMLAEAEIPELLNKGCFVMDYGWDLHKLLTRIARFKGAAAKQVSELVQGNLQDTPANSQIEEHHAYNIDTLLQHKWRAYHKGYQMYFTSNHDENAWAGTAHDWFGEGHEAFAVLTATMGGMPLLYSGMESATDQQFRFFSKDEINWGNFKNANFYKALFSLKHRNRALWNGKHGGRLVKLPSGADHDIYAFTREKEGDRVIVLVNLSGITHQVRIPIPFNHEPFRSLFTGEELLLTPFLELSIAPWDYRVFSNR